MRPAVPRPLARSVDAALEATVVASFSRIGCEVRRRLDRWRPAEQLDGHGRTVVVTGANSGIGYAVARSLLRAGAAVRTVVRSDVKGRDTVAALRRDVGAEADVSAEVADLTDLASVHDLAERLHRTNPCLDAVVHVAGAMFDTRGDTVDGLERTYQLHVVAPHLLTTLLLDRLAAASTPRVVTVTSGGMYAAKLDVDELVDPDPSSYRGAAVYAQAKRAQVVLTEQWSHRFGGRGVAFHVVHPGWVLTPGVERSLPGFRRVMGPILRDPDQGADGIVWLALSDEPHVEGRLWLDRRPRLPHRVPWTIADATEADRLWTRVTRDAGVGGRR